MGNSEKTKKIVIGAMIMCLTMLMTVAVRIPVPLTQGYVHLGDSMVFFGVMIMGRKYGAICGGFGAARADVIGGFAMWAPWTLAIKAMTAFIMGTVLRDREVTTAKEIASIIAGGLVMVAGYFVAEGIMYGNWGVAAIGIPWNVGQFALGGIISIVLTAALSRTKTIKVFEHTVKAKG